MSLIEIIAISVLGVLLTWQLFYWIFFMFRVRKKPRSLASKLPDVSIIICAKNEDENLRRLIHELVEQKYAAAKQIIIVDDCSTDETPLVIAQMRAKYPEVYTTTIPGDAKFKHGKKLALNVGIKAAKHDKMIFIDADCVPASEHWLTSMIEPYADQDKQMVLGYGRYAKHPGLLNLMIRFETFWNAVQYFGFASALRPFMGVGRNLSYTKTLFDKSSKFRHNLNILSGDDDMFVSEMGTRKNTASVFISAAHTVSEPQRTWLGYSTQKSRHLTTAPLYPASVKFWLTSELLTRVLFWIATVGLAVFGFMTENPIIMWSAVGAFAARMLTIYISLGLSARNMGESKMWILALPMDLLIPLMQGMAWLTGTLTQSRNTWK